MKKSPLGFSMPHNTDSIAASKAWQNFKQGYAKVGKVETGEYDREKHEFYYDINKKKLRLIPTDDAERQNESFKSNLKRWQLPPLDRRSPLNQNGEKAKDVTRYLADGSYDMTPGVSEEEAKKVRDKFDATYMQGRGRVNETEPHADSEWENATYQLMNEGTISESNDEAYPLIEARVKRNRGNK